MNYIKNYFHGKYNFLNTIILYFLLTISVFRIEFSLFILLFNTFSLCLNKDNDQILFHYFSCVIFHVAFYNKVFIINNIIITLILLFKLLLKLIKKEVNINWLTIILFAMNVIYLSLSFGYKITESIKLFRELSIILIVFVAYYLKDELNFEKLAKLLTFSLLFNVLLSFLFQSDLYLFDATDGVFRFVGFQEHPNIIAQRGIFVISCIMLLKYYEKINDSIFLAIYSIIIFLGILSVSRLFLFGMGLLYIMFGVIYYMKNNDDKYKVAMLLLEMAAIVCVLSLILSDEVKSFFIRFERDETLAPEISGEALKQVLDGQQHYDFGRLSLWKLYFKKITESLKTILFGFGISAPLIGEMKAHCCLISYIYKNGIVGLLLLFLLAISMIDVKKFLQIKKNLPLYMFICSFFSIALINENVLFAVPYIMIIALANEKIISKTPVIIISK